MPDITIREATEADWPALARLRADWSAEQGNADNDDTTFERTFTEWVAANPRVTFVAERDENPVGMMTQNLIN